MKKAKIKDVAQAIGNVKFSLIVNSLISIRPLECFKNEYSKSLMNSLVPDYCKLIFEHANLGDTTGLMIFNNHCYYLVKKTPDVENIAILNLDALLHALETEHALQKHHKVLEQQSVLNQVVIYTGITAGIITLYKWMFRD